MNKELHAAMVRACIANDFREVMIPPTPEAIDRVMASESRRVLMLKYDMIAAAEAAEQFYRDLRKSPG